MDWRRRQQAQADVKRVTEMALDRGLPRSLSEEMYSFTCAAAYQRIYDSYTDGSHSVYSGAA